MNGSDDNSSPMVIESAELANGQVVTDTQRSDEKIAARKVVVDIDSQTVAWKVVANAQGQTRRLPRRK